MEVARDASPLLPLAIVLPFARLQPLHLRWDAIATLVVLGAGIAYILDYRLITDEGTTASIVTYLLPIGAAILNDHIAAQIIGGMRIVLMSVAIMRRAQHSGVTYW